MAGINYDPDVVEILRRHYREWELKTLPTTVSRSRLSTDIRARRGDSPATGLSTNSSELAGGRKETTEFLSSIGAARAAPPPTTLSKARRSATFTAGSKKGD